MEGQGVVGVALQRAHDQIVGTVIGRIGRAVEGVADRVGQQRVRADLDEHVVIGTGPGDGLLEVDRVAHVGRPVLGIEDGARNRPRTQVGVGGRDDRDGGLSRGEIGQLATHLRLQRIHGRVVRGHLDAHSSAVAVALTHRLDERVDLLRRSGYRGLPW